MEAAGERFRIDTLNGLKGPTEHIQNQRAAVLDRSQRRRIK
jgi:hypothetical protein